MVSYQRMWCSYGSFIRLIPFRLRPSRLANAHWCQTHELVLEHLPPSLPSTSLSDLWLVHILRMVVHRSLPMVFRG